MMPLKRCPCLPRKERPQQTRTRSIAHGLEAAIALNLVFLPVELNLSWGYSAGEGELLEKAAKS